MRHFLPFILSASFIVFISCKQVNSSVDEGEKLAHTHCVTCHSFPEPSLLDKKTWSENVLPVMADFMNVERIYNNNKINDQHNKQQASPAFSYTDWEKIVKWYIESAPEKPLERTAQQPAIKTGLKKFVQHPVGNLVDFPITSLIRFDTTDHRIIIGDGNARKIFFLNQSFKVVDSFDAPVGMTDIHKQENGFNVVSMGILEPSDAKLGKLVTFGVHQNPKLIIDTLIRPVQATYADLDNDGLVDIIVSEFGYRLGSLSWYKSKSDSSYERKLLKLLPGAVGTEVYDFNKDGKADILTMIAQGDEGLFIFYNEGNGKFKEQRIAQFPPAYGSNSFSIADFNKDGYPDIITTNGDNGDYSIIPKAYHGIRIFLNDGKNSFSEYKFLPVYGVQKALAKDFDNDGDLDIVSIAFFPDYERYPEESFIFWENKGDLSFERYTFTEANNGRWMTMDAADMDNDGDTDIILGNAAFGLGKVPDSLKDKWKKYHWSAVILENKMIDRR